MRDAKSEIDTGERFAFGANWTRFLDTLDDQRIRRAEQSLQQMLGLERFDGLNFLDAGSGSGLFSLTACRLGARVRSFDFDAQSVACTAELKRRYFPGHPHWQVEQGSLLDTAYLSGLGRFDIVYSWGVLQHTGEMWHALENVAARVAAGGRRFVAIYNDQGYRSRAWAWIKRTYNRHRWMRPLRLAYGVLRTWGPTTARDFCRLRPLATWTAYAVERGMSPWWDVVDWIGGWPFEVASPEAVFRFCRDRDFRLQELVTRQAYGCNEFVFVRTPG
ncbi:MAG: class I SAM-dependent methyltransferase [Rhodocyclaceae bacterium]|nr:class I SAM-dependent methyltransferase [Rhodocyclaceae bacterium]